jgi:hypothetical protein
LAIAWGYEGAWKLEWRFKDEPYNFMLASFDENKYISWRKEIERKGYNFTRREKSESDTIREKLEERNIKEGADIEVDGIWVKSKSLYSKGKENKETTQRVLSFRENYDVEIMEPYRRDIYWETMKQIVNEYKEKRIRDAKARKENAEKKRKMKIKAEEKPIIEDKKTNVPIIKKAPKPITIEKAATKPIIISKAKCDPIIITKSKEAPRLKKNQFQDQSLYKQGKNTLQPLKR